MKFHLLIVDDDQIILMLHKRIVMREGLGNNPQSFLNGKEALEYIRRNNSSDDTHLVLLDINMPVMNGWEFLEALNSESSEANVHVVMATSSTDKADYEMSKNYSHVFDFLLKPLEPNALDGIKNNPLLGHIYND